MANPLKAQKWLAFRNTIIERDEDRCVRCGRSSDEGAILQVHHKIYFDGKEPWEYEDHFCETLCKGCHAAEHGIIPPQTGWKFLCEDDLGGLDGECEYCGSELRYVFYIQHTNWPVIGVGTICCDNLTGTQIASDQRNYTNREKTFLKSTRWKFSDGIHSITQKKIHFKIIPKGLKYIISLNDFEGRELYSTIDIAKKKIFEITENGEAQKFWLKKKPA